MHVMFIIVHAIDKYDFLKEYLWLGMMVSTYNPATQKAEAEG